MKIEEFKNLEGNPRKISKPKMNFLKKMIQKNEDLMKFNKIKINKQGTVLAGNHRVMALRELGHKDIPEDWYEVVNPKDEMYYALIHNMHLETAKTSSRQSSSDTSSTATKIAAPKLDKAIELKISFTPEEYQFLETWNIEDLKEVIKQKMVL